MLSDAPRYVDGKQAKGEEQSPEGEASNIVAFFSKQLKTITNETGRDRILDA